MNILELILWAILINCVWLGGAILILGIPI